MNLCIIVGAAEHHLRAFAVDPVQRLTKDVSKDDKMTVRKVQRIFHLFYLCRNVEADPRSKNNLFSISSGPKYVLLNIRTTGKTPHSDSDLENYQYAVS